MLTTPPIIINDNESVPINDNGESKTNKYQHYKLLVNIPTNFNSNNINNLLWKYGLESTTIPKKSLPQSLIDLKSFINSRTIIDHKDLVNKILDFNYRSKENLFKIYNQDSKVKINPYFIWNNEIHSYSLPISLMIKTK